MLNRYIGSIQQVLLQSEVSVSYCTEKPHQSYGDVLRYRSARSGTASLNMSVRLTARTFYHFQSCSLTPTLSPITKSPQVNKDFQRGAEAPLVISSGPDSDDPWDTD